MSAKPHSWRTFALTMFQMWTYPVDVQSRHGLIQQAMEITHDFRDPFLTTLLMDMGCSIPLLWHFPLPMDSSQNFRQRKVCVLK
eukprot:5679697-Amphidinium_carterae.1